MKIWLDDVREPPDDSWWWCKSAQEFSNLFGYQSLVVTDISFDHDLASFDVVGNEMTGYHCLCMVEKKFRYDNGFALPRMRVHSANPVGRQRMQKVIDALEIFNMSKEGS